LCPRSASTTSTTLDSLGPIASTVADAALLLSVIAGEDWRDPQWVRGFELDDYVAAATPSRASASG
jgi:Asp-tRNA(Asn)/Glu-tRNA(Gln) amidotransferase A subunit family amidase